MSKAPMFIVSMAWNCLKSFASVVSFRPNCSAAFSSCWVITGIEFPIVTPRTTPAVRRRLTPSHSASWYRRRFLHSHHSCDGLCFMKPKNIGVRFIYSTNRQHSDHFFHHFLHNVFVAIIHRYQHSIGSVSNDDGVDGLSHSHDLTQNNTIRHSTQPSTTAIVMAMRGEARLWKLWWLCVATRQLSTASTCRLASPFFLWTRRRGDVTTTTTTTTTTTKRQTTDV